MESTELSAVTAQLDADLTAAKDRLTAKFGEAVAILLCTMANAQIIYSATTCGASPDECDCDPATALVAARQGMVMLMDNLDGALQAITRKLAPHANQDDLSLEFGTIVELLTKSRDDVTAVMNGSAPPGTLIQ